MYSTTVTYRTAPAINEAMGRVYFQMMLAVIMSMFVAGNVAASPALLNFFFTGVMKWVVIFAPLVAVFAIPFVLNKQPPTAVAFGLLHGFAALMGLSMAMLFAVYTLGSIVTAFMGAAVLFGVLSAYGYFTKQNLDSIGKYCFVALIAIIIASIVNIFIGSSAFQMLISAVAIVVFLGLTAYDTQQIRENISQDSAGTTEEIMGALTLYLNFINLFISLLQLLGGRKE